MMTNSSHGLEDSVTIASGRLRDVEVTVFSVMRDELFFLPAFFDHYRRLQVEQFIVLDDGSTDGTTEFLAAQPDCVLTTSPISFGETVHFADGTKHKAGLLLKRALPSKFLQNKYAIYADADEFLLLPRDLRSVQHLFEILRDHDIDAVAASLVEFYPETLKSMREPLKPLRIEDLFSAYPFFDGHPLLALRSGEWPTEVGQSTTARLFRKHKIDHVPWYLQWLSQTMSDRLFGKRMTGGVMKTPVARWSSRVYLNNSHETSVPPTDQLLLAVAHFKFTYDLFRRVDRSMVLRSHAGQSRKYFQYDRLLSSNSSDDRVLTAPHTRRFNSIDDLKASGLLFSKLLVTVDL
jgi:glycosyltransferase involved in cell wall biosynthesis